MINSGNIVRFSLIFKTVEDESKFAGIRIKNNVLSGIKAIASEAPKIDLGKNFSANVDKQTEYFTSFRNAVNKGMAIDEAKIQYLSSAMQATRDYVNETNFAEQSQEGLKTAVTQSQVALVAQGNSLSNTRSLIAEYNSGLNTTGNVCKETGLSQAQFTQAVAQSRVGLGNYLSNLDGAKASMGGYIAQLVGAKIASVGLQIATTALNIGITMVASLLVSTLVTAIMDYVNASQKAIEKAEESKNAIKDISDTLEEQKSTLADTKDNFAKLAQGVDMVTGKNKSLSTAEYEAFLDISNQLADQFSTLPVIYDENGNAIVQLNGNVNDITGSLENLLKVEQELANQKITEKLGDLYSGAYEKNKGYQKELTELTKQYEAGLKSAEILKSSPFKIGSGGRLIEGKWVDYEETTAIAQEFRNILETGANKNLSGRAEIGGAIKGDFFSHSVKEWNALKDIYSAVLKKYGISFASADAQDHGRLDFDYAAIDFQNQDQLTDEMINQMVAEVEKIDDVSVLFDETTNTLRAKISSKEQEIKQNWSSLASSLGAWLNTEDSFSTLSDEMQGIVQRTVNSLDYSKLNFENIDKAKEYIQNHIIDVFQSSKFDYEKYNNLNTAFDQFKNGEITLAKYRETYNQLETSLSNIDGITDETKNAVLSGFDAIGGGGETLDTVTERVEELSNGIIKADKAEGLMKKWKYDDISTILKIDKDTLDSYGIAVKSIDDLKKAVEQFKATDTDSFDVDAFIMGVQDRQKNYAEFMKQSAFKTGINLYSEYDTKGNLKTLGADALADYYGDIKDFDKDKLLNRTAQGIKINTEELTRLNNEVNKAKKIELDTRLEKLRTKYDDLTSKILNCTDAQKKANYEEERTGIIDDIEETELLAANYEALTSKYQAWQDALSNGEEGDSYDAIRDKLKDIKELYDKGLVGTNEFRTYVDLLTFKDLSTAKVDDIVKAYDNLDNNIKNTSYSVKDFLKEDEQGVNNFLSAMKELGYYTQGEDGQWTLKIADKESLAKQLGISTEFLENIVQKLDDYDFTVDIDIGEMSDNDLQNAFDDVRKKLKKAKLTDMTFSFDESTTESQVDDQLKEIRKIIHKKWITVNGEGQEVVEFDIDDENAKAAQIILANLLKKKQEFQDSGTLVLSVDVDKDLKDPKSDAGRAINNIQSFNKGMNKYQVAIQTGSDTKKSTKKITNAVKALNSIKDKKVRAELGLDDKKFKKAIKNVKANVKTGADLDQKDINLIKSKIKGIDAKALVHLGVDNKDVAEEKKRQEDEVVNKIVKFSVEKGEVLKFKKEDHDVKAIVKYYPQIDETTFNTLLNSVKTRLQNQLKNTNTPKKTKKKKAKVNGTAFARGNWGAKDSGTALGGELKPEIHVFANSGRWELIGERSPEFFNYRKGDIIFNGEQTEQLLKYGKINYGSRRGNSFLGGTAFAGSSARGSINLDRQGLIPKSKSTKKSSSSSDSKSGFDNKTNKDTPKDTQKDTPLDKFKNWFGALFDWIEIKLERQTDKISDYVSKAERAMERGSYDASVKNYRKAINTTSELVETEAKASRRYNKQAQKTLDVAVSKGVIKKKRADSIKKLVKSGKIDIKKYSEDVREVIGDYQQWYDKAKEAKKSIGELHNNIRTYIKDLKDVRDAQRQAKLDKQSTFTDIATSGFAFTSAFKNSQLTYQNSQLDAQNSAYKTETDKVISDSKSIGDTAKNALSNKSLGKAKPKKNQTKYKNAIKNAKKAIKSKKPVKDADLKTIKKHSVKAYEKLYAYNLSLDNVETAKLERVANYAETSNQKFANQESKYENNRQKSEDNISLFRQRSDNATSASGKNSQLDKVVAQYKKQQTDRQTEIDNFANQAKSSGKTISKQSTKGSGDYSKYITQAKNSVSAGITISATTLAKLAEGYSKGKITAGFYQSCIDYNNALQYKKQAEDQQEIENETIKSEKRAIGAEKISNIQRDYQNKLYNNRVNGLTSEQLGAMRDIKTSKGLSLNTNDYQQQIQLSQQERSILVAEQQDLINQMNQNISDGLWTYDSQEYLDAAKALDEIGISIAGCTKNEIEWNNAIINLPFEKYEKALQIIDKVKSAWSSYASMMKTIGKDLDKSVEKAYFKQIDEETEHYQITVKQTAEAWSNYQRALADSEGVYGGKTAEEWYGEYHDFAAAQYSTYENIKKIKDELRDEFYLKPFEKAIEKAEKLNGLLEGIAEFIDESMYYDKDGKITEYGIAQVGLLTAEYEGARKQVGNYQAELDEVNRLYKEGYYTADEYADKINEVQINMLNSAKDMKSSMNSIVNMYKEMAKAELDSLLKLIDVRKEALNSKKSYYDLDKSLRDKNSEIQNLEAQIAALETMDDLESKAQRARLQADLKEKQDDLNETVNDHLIEISQNALDDLKDSLQDAFDDKWEHIFTDLSQVTQLMTAANALTKGSTLTINNTLNKLLDYYGIDPNKAQLNDVVTTASVGYASGTRSVSQSGLAWTQEGRKPEFIIRKSDGAILTPLSRGDGVIPNDLTDNLFAWGKVTPEEFIGKSGAKYNLPETNVNNNVYNNYDSLIRVEGNVDSTVITDLKAFGKQFYEDSYQYTHRRIVSDLKKIGVKR